ncbi:MAG TPA: hypothetical protein VMY76_00635 [Gemmatimonadales bacterium]|nr:hypothetical protein [Gemmatimonadales bacterium]
MADAAPPAPAAPAGTSSPGSPQVATVPPDAAKTPPAGKEQSPAPAPRKVTLKIRGQTRELDEESVHAYAQKALAGEDGLAALAKARSDFEAQQKAWTAEQERLKTDTAAFLEKAGLNPKEWAAKYVLEQFGGEEGQPLTPEQEELRALKAEKAEREKRDQAAAEQAKQERLKKQALAKGQQYREKFATALGELGLAAGDPAVPGIIVRMAADQQRMEEEGIDLPPRALAQMAVGAIQKEQAMAWGRLQGDALLSALGPDLEAKATAAIVAKFKRQRAEQGQPTPAVAPPDGRPRDEQGRYASTAPVSRERMEYERRLGIVK